MLIVANHANSTAYLVPRPLKASRDLLSLRKQGGQGFTSGPLITTEHTKHVPFTQRWERYYGSHSESKACFPGLTDCCLLMKNRPLQSQLFQRETMQALEMHEGLSVYSMTKS